MTPEEAVQSLADLLAPQEMFDEDTVYRLMAEAGIPNALADRAYKLTQTAWARTFLGGMGIQFSPEYLWFSASGEIVEAGALADEPFYVAATRLAPRYASTAGFRRLVVMSSDVDSVNQALNAGSKPEDLVLAPLAMFREAPSPGGVERARQVLADRLAKIRRA